MRRKKKRGRNSKWMKRSQNKKQITILFQKQREGAIQMANAFSGVERSRNVAMGGALLEFWPRNFRNNFRKN